MNAGGSGDGDADDVDVRSLAICEDAAVGSFLEDFLCEEGIDALDEDFLEEFRKSESFAQVLREHGIEQGSSAAAVACGGSSSQSVSSRRASLNESERGTVQSNSSQRDSSRGLSQQYEDPFPPLVPSHQASSYSRRVQEAPRKGSSPSPDKRRKKTDQARQKIVLSESSSSQDDDSDDENFDGSRSRKKLNDKLKIRPSTSPSVKQRKGESPHKKQNKSQERAPVHQSPVKKKSKSDLPLEGTSKRLAKEYIRNHVQATIQPIKSFRIRLVDLKMLTNLFPNGLPGKIKITSKLLDELEQCEMKIRNSKIAFPKKVSVESSKGSSNEQVLHHHQQNSQSNVAVSVPDNSDVPLYIDEHIVKPRSEEKSAKIKRAKEDYSRKLDKVPPNSSKSTLSSPEKALRKTLEVLEDEAKQMTFVQEKPPKRKVPEVESKRKEPALLVEKSQKKKLTGDKTKSRALSSSPSPERSSNKKALEVVGKSKEARSSLEKIPKKKLAEDKDKSRALSSSPSPERISNKKGLEVVVKSKEARSSLEKSPKKKLAEDKRKSRALSSSPSPERSSNKKGLEVVVKSKEARSSLEKSPKKKLAEDKHKSRALSSSPSPERSPKKIGLEVEGKSKQARSLLEKSQSHKKKVPEGESRNKEVASSLEKNHKKISEFESKSKRASSSPERSLKKNVSITEDQTREKHPSVDKSPKKTTPEILGRSRSTLSPEKSRIKTPDAENKSRRTASPEKSHIKESPDSRNKSKRTESPEKSHKKKSPDAENKSKRTESPEKSHKKKSPDAENKSKRTESPEKSHKKKSPDAENKSKRTESPEKSPVKKTEVEKSKITELHEKSPANKTVDTEDKSKEATSSLDKSLQKKSTDVECIESTKSTPEKNPEETALEGPDKLKSKEAKPSPKKPNPFSVLSFATLNEKLKAKNTSPEKSKPSQPISSVVKEKTAEYKESALVLDAGDKSKPITEKTPETNIPATPTSTQSKGIFKDVEPMEPPLAAPEMLDNSKLLENVKIEKNSAISSPLKKTDEESKLVIPLSSHENKLSTIKNEESVETAAETSIPVETESKAASKESESLGLGPAKEKIQSTPLPEENTQPDHEEIKPADADQEKSLSSPVLVSKPEEQCAQVLEDTSVPKSSSLPEKINTLDNIKTEENPPSPEQVDTDMPSPPPSPSHSHPGDDSREPSSPEVTEPKKLSSPDRVISKKKNIIESSSDDGDNRKEDADITDGDDHDTPPDDGRNKSSDDEVTGSKKSVRFAHNPSIQRERDQEDSRSGKFGEFEMERQRKQRKDGKLSKGKIDPLEEIMKDTMLTGSFRIPRKTTSSSRKTAYIDSIIVRTPLTGAAAEVPKENMQFERFREGLSNKHVLEKKEKDLNKNRGGDWNTKNTRDTGDSGNTDFRGGNRDKSNKESGPIDRFNLKDDGRKVVLLPEDGKPGSGNAREGEDVVDSSTSPRGGDNDGLPDPEPNWDDDGPQGDSPDIGSGGNNDNVGDNNNESSKVSNDLGKQQSKQKTKDDGITSTKDLSLTIQNIKKDDESETNTVDLPRLKLQNIKKEVDIKEIKQEPDDTPSATKKSKKSKEEEAVLLNPEVPIKSVEVSPFSIGAMMLLMQDPNPQLPDVEQETNLAESTVIKLAWWISKADFENSTEPGSSNEWYVQVDRDSDDSSDGGASEGSYLDRLECSLSEDDEIFHSLPRDLQRKTMGPLDEYCGKQLLESKYRSGPGDKFSNIFQTRGGVSDNTYFKTNLQTQCTLCNHFLIGKAQVATHVLSNYHREKMSQAGLNDVKTGGNGSADKQKDKTTDVKKSVADSTSSEVDKEEKDKERKEKEKKDDGKHKDKKRKRSNSKDRSSSEKGAEIGVTSTGAIPDKEKDKDRKRRSDSKDKSHKRNRSRSKSPRKDRDRSRKSRSRSPHGSRRRRSRSRDRERDRAREREPIVRISRSPAKLRESRRERSRSTSAERVKKFLAKTQRRSRSPSNGYNRKRHRHSSPPADTGVLPKKTNQEFHEKLTLTAEGKWTEELEANWKMMELEEAIFMEQFGEKSKTLKTTPESHPDYANEWTAFWERRYQEIEDEGKEDPDKHNYVPEWKDFWNKRLREVLDKEYEDGINAIKVRHGVDIETLQKIRNTPKEPVVVAQLVQPQPMVMMQVPRPVPPPSCLPMGVPPPQIMMVQSPSIQGTVTPSSKSASDIGDDMNARPMSISDGGDVRPAPANVKPTAPSPAVTTTDIMSTWNKLKSGESVTSNQGSSNSGKKAATVQQPLRSLSISKTTSERSAGESSASASIDSYTFSSGMDIGQVLRIMTNLEDQLSFFAPKVLEYFHKAEELDLKRRNKSYILLQDEDFVAMMFQIRDRFMAQIRAHILPKGILDNLNLAAYGLNGILDHPDCQKRRPRVVEPESAPRPEPQPQLKEEQAPGQHNTFSARNVNDTFTRPTSKSLDSNPIRRLSDSKKREISVLLTHFLLTMGRDDIQDGELKELVLKMCAQQSTSSSASSSARNSASNTPQHSRGGEGSRNSDSSVQPTRFGEPSLDPWRMPERNMTKVCSVASVQSTGTAAPELPNVIIPPQFHNPTSGSGGTGAIRFGAGSGGEGGNRNDRSRGRGYGQYDGGDNYMSSGSSSGPGGSGRHSPFSRRDFTGNPAHSSYSYRDKESGTPYISTTAPVESRRCSASTQEKHKKNNDGNNMPVVTVGTTSKLASVKKRSAGEHYRDPEIQMNQLTKFKENRPVVGNRRPSDSRPPYLKEERCDSVINRRPSYDYNRKNDHDRSISPERKISLDRRNSFAEEQITYSSRRPEDFEEVSRMRGSDDQRRVHNSRRTSRDETSVVEEGQQNPPKLPPGIMNMIIRERNMKQKQETAEMGEILSGATQSDHDSDSYRRRKRKRKRKKKKSKSRKNKNNVSSDEEEDDSDGSKYARDRSKERRSRRERKKKRSIKDHESSSVQSDYEKGKIRRRRSPSPPSPNYARRSSRRSNRSSSYDDQERYQSRSRHASQTKQRSESRGRNRERSHREHYPQSPPPPKWDEESRRRQSGSPPPRSNRHPSRLHLKNVYQGGNQIAAMTARAVSPLPFHESDWENSGNEENSQTVNLTVANPQSNASALDVVDLSDDEIVFLPTPLKDSSKVLLQENNVKPKEIERKSSRRNLENLDMFAPSPPASVNSGSSGYRKTKERRSVTTINVPGSKPMSRLENCEILSDVSSLGENRRGPCKEVKTTIPDENPKDHENRNVSKEKNLVTSVSETFWTAKDDDDAKSFSSVSSADIGPTKPPCSTVEDNPCDKESVLKPVSTSVAASTTAVPLPASVAGVVRPRNYRVSRDRESDKEPGELSSCSSSENYT